MKWRDPEEEYSSRPNLKREDVQKILEWTSMQPHLPNITEIEAILFLHSCYYDLDQAKKTLETYYTFRTHTPEFFGDRDTGATEILDIMETQLHAPLPGHTPEGYKIIFFKLLDCDPGKFGLVPTCRLYSFVSDLLLWTEGTAEGHILLIDLKGLALGHLFRLKLFLVKKYITYLQDDIPLRIKGFYFINANYVTNKLILMIKPFMNKQLTSTLLVFTDMESVYKVIPQEMFPKELGGQSKSIAELHQDTKEAMASHRDFFLEQEKTRLVDEELRPGNRKTANKIFGTGGLNFD